jgi:hypothetical protein
MGAGSKTLRACRAPWSRGPGRIAREARRADMSLLARRAGFGAVDALTEKSTKPRVSAVGHQDSRSEGQLGRSLSVHTGTFGAGGWLWYVGAILVLAGFSNLAQVAGLTGNQAGPPASVGAAAARFVIRSSGEDLPASRRIRSSGEDLPASRRIRSSSCVYVRRSTP